MASSSTASAAAASAASPAPDDSQEEPDCGICLDKVTIRGVLDSCDHAFCFECIFRWSKESNTCPMCKQRFHQLQKTSKTKDAEASADASETSKRPTRKKAGSKGPTSRKRKRGDTSVDSDVVSVPHRDQRPDIYQPSLIDMLDLINSMREPRRGPALPLFHFVGLPFGMVRPRPTVRRAANDAPINIDDDDNDDMDIHSIPDIDSDHESVFHRTPYRSHYLGMHDEDDDEDDDSPFATRSPHAPRHFMNAIFDRVMSSLRPASPPPPPSRPLKHIREGDRMIIDLTDDDPVPQAAPAAPISHRLPPRPVRAPSTTSEVITLDDDDDSVAQIIEPTRSSIALPAEPNSAQLPSEPVAPISSSAPNSSISERTRSGRQKSLRAERSGD